jgi:hypothetical protein
VSEQHIIPATLKQMILCHQNEIGIVRSQRRLAQPFPSQTASAHEVYAMFAISPVFRLRVLIVAGLIALTSFTASQFATAQSTALHEWTWMGGALPLEATAKQATVSRVDISEPTVHWVHHQQATTQGALMARRVGQIAMAISGSLAALDTVVIPASLAPSTAFGSSILPLTNGRGWVEAVYLRSILMVNRECTARWEHLLPGISPEAGMAHSLGPTKAAISGSSEAAVMMPTVRLAN